jgi:serine/threonine-protein kinase
VITVGSLVGKYVVRAKIGEGAMGTVYLGQHQVLDSRVAIKVIRQTGHTSDEDVSRFFTEARAASKIGHENIVTILDVGRTDGGDPFYIMELLTGESLLGRLGRGRRPLDEVLHVAQQIAGALTASHHKGIVHRDLKPANVFLIKRGADASFAKVLDFGVAKLTDESERPTDHRTQTGRLLGTPHYMAPEQVAGRRAVDGRADVYALGVMLFEMVSGRLPFDAPKWTEVLIQHVTVSPPRVRDLAGDCPVWLDRLVAKALAKSPTDRPTMAAMRDALRLGDGGALVVSVPAAPSDEPKMPGGPDTLPSPDAAETLVEAKLPSSPSPPPSNPRRPPPELGPSLAPLSGATTPRRREEVANADTLVSSDPKVAPSANLRLIARGRRRMIGAALIGALGGGGVLVAAAAIVRTDSGAEPGANVDVDGGRPSRDAGARGIDQIRRMRLELMTHNALADLSLPGPESLKPPPLPPVAVGAGSGAGGVTVIVDAGGADARPPRRPDAYDIQAALYPTIDVMRYCRNRYDPELRALDVTVVVQGDGWIREVILPAAQRGTPFEMCATTAVRDAAAFTMFTDPTARVPYHYEFVDIGE